MNFEYMPELDWRYGYPLVLLVIAIVLRAALPRLQAQRLAVARPLGRRCARSTSSAAGCGGHAHSHAAESGRDPRQQLPGRCRSAAVTKTTVHPASRSRLSRRRSLANWPRSACQSPSYSSATLRSGQAKSTRATKPGAVDHPVLGDRRRQPAAAGSAAAAASPAGDSGQPVREGADRARPRRTGPRRPRRGPGSRARSTTPGRPAGPTATTASSPGAPRQPDRSRLGRGHRDARRHRARRGPRSRPAGPGGRACAAGARSAARSVRRRPRPGEVTPHRTAALRPGDHRVRQEERRRVRAQRVRDRHVAGGRRRRGRGAARPAVAAGAG